MLTEHVPLPAYGMVMLTVAMWANVSGVVVLYEAYTEASPIVQFTLTNVFVAGKVYTTWIGSV